MASKGWIKIHREILDNDLWESVEPFCRRAAFIDLILLANHDHANVFDEPVSRGQHLTSLRKLQKRWHWRYATVKSFLDLMQRQGMLAVNYRKTSVLITVSNYNKYQTIPEGNTKGSTLGSSKGSTLGSTLGTQTRMSKNDIKNDKEIGASPSSSNGERE